MPVSIVLYIGFDTGFWGEDQAVDALGLFHRYRDDVCRLAVNYTSIPEEAEDVSRAVFLKLVEHGELMPGTERDFLMQTTADTCRNLLHSGGWKRTVKDIFLSPKTDKPPQGVLRLPPKYRVVMYLRYYEDFTTGEIARLLKIPQSTAAARLSRGRGLLERQLRKGAA
jgi:DNA-directed RNA polymerase specialized sigma24 family protein